MAAKAKPKSSISPESRKSLSESEDDYEPPGNHKKSISVASSTKSRGFFSDRTNMNNFLNEEPAKSETTKQTRVNLYSDRKEPNNTTKENKNLAEMFKPVIKKHFYDQRDKSEFDNYKIPKLNSKPVWREYINL